MADPTLLTGLVKSWRAITPSNSQSGSAQLGVDTAIGLYITTAGNVSFDDADGNRTTVACPSNFILPCFITQVRSTGTTATGIFALTA